MSENENGYTSVWMDENGHIINEENNKNKKKYSRMGDRTCFTMFNQGQKEGGNR